MKCHELVSVNEIPVGPTTVVGRQSQGISGDRGIIRDCFRLARSTISPRTSSVGPLAKIEPRSTFCALNH